METIDGRPVVHEAVILREGWEMDNRLWVTDDHRIWSTSHGGAPQEISAELLAETIAETERSLESLRRAQALAAWRKE